MIDEYILYFDGCSKGNPGLAGAGAVIYKNNQEIWSNALYIGSKHTNNYAEYSGLISGLEHAIQLKIKHLIVKGDSNLVIKQMKGEYQVKSDNIKDLYHKAKTLEKHQNKNIYFCFEIYLGKKFTIFSQ